MPRTLNPTLEAALDSGNFQPYFLVSVREVGQANPFLTAKPVMFRLSGVEMHVKYPNSDVPVFEGYRPEEVEFKLTRGVTVAGVDYAIDSSWHYGLSSAWDGHFETAHASMLPNLRSTVAGDQTYEQVIDAVLAEYGKTAVFKDEAAAWLDYQFLGDGRQVQLNRGRDFLTLLRQKYLIYATDNGSDEILFHHLGGSSPTSADHTLSMERFEIDISSHHRRFLSRDENNSVSYSGNADAPLWNLGYLESTASHPTANASTRTTIKPIAPHLKYLTFDAFTFNFGPHYPGTSFTQLANMTALVTEEFDKDHRELAWRITLSSFDWAGGTEGGALPGTIEAAAPYTPLNTSKFGGILDATDNNIQAAMETIDDHTHPHSHAIFNDAEGDPAAVAPAAADGTSTYAARRDHVHAGTMVLIAEQVLGSDTPTFDFQNIPATFSHLQIILNARSDRNATSDQVKIRFNNDSGNNYVGMVQWAGGNQTQTTPGAPFQITFVNAVTASANWFNNSIITIVDYANTNKYRDYQSRGMQLTTSGGTAFIYDGMGMYLQTTAISRVTLFPGFGSNFKQYSTARLYGIK